MPLPVIHAYGLLKAAAAKVNAANGRLDEDRARAIAQAANEVSSGALDQHFPIAVWQTGSGTQSHMNVNEVIAHRANQILGVSSDAAQAVHPNDHVNMGQSSNDTFPTVMHLAILRELPQLVASLDVMIDSTRSRAQQWAEVVTIGRTHLQDAVPMTVGAQWRSYSSSLSAHRQRISRAAQDLQQLSLGGTAVGTGLNAFPGFASEVLDILSQETGMALEVSSDLPMAMSTLDASVATSATLRGLAVTLLKIADDIRLLASGPRTGIHEIVLPPNEPGSSIMPGKVNPTQAEMLVMVSMQVMALDGAVAHAGSHGELQLNVMRPLVILNILNAIDLLADAMHSFTVNCLDTIDLDYERINSYVQRSPMLVTALAPHIGYDKASAIAKHAMANEMPLRQAAIELGVAEDLYDRVVNPVRMARAEE